LGVLLELAWGLSADDEEMFFSLLDCGVRLAATDAVKCLNEAEVTFQKGRAQFIRMLSPVLIGLGQVDCGGNVLARSAMQLAEVHKDRPWREWWSVATSHVHMTSNRLGLCNAEEVYVARLMRRTAETVRHEMPGVWRSAWRSRPVLRSAARSHALSEYASGAVSELGRLAG
jgi:hypothetical protein